MRRITGLGLVLALGLAGAGCGGADDEPVADPVESTTEDEGSTTTGEDTTTSVAAPGAGCAYLDVADLDAAFGTTFTEDASTAVGCVFSETDGITVALNRIDIAIDPETYAEESTESCDEGSLVEVDAGDRAYACLAVGPLASYYERDVAISLTVLSGGDDDEQAVLDAFVAVLPAIRLP